MNTKVLYISNVDLGGTLIPGVVEKIRGQVAAFGRNGFSADVLYPGGSSEIVIEKTSGEWKKYPGAREMKVQHGIVNKLRQHLTLAWFGPMNFDKCCDEIIRENYHAIYLRFFIPGLDLVRFLKRVKKESPGTIILLEYPTLNVGPLMKTDKARWISYLINKRRIGKMNKAANFIITLTKDKELFGKPAVFMPNGFDFKDTDVSEPKSGERELVLLGVASDCAHYHGYDKIIKGLGDYYRKGNELPVYFRIVSSLLGHNMSALRKLAEEENVADKVIFCGLKSKNELADEYRNAHIGIGTLALHRIGLMDNYSLKHREYAAFGLPFIMSLGDDAFEHSPFVFVTERDEKPVNIERLLGFYSAIQKEYTRYPEVFRNSMEKLLSWDKTMQGVFDAIRV